MSISSSTHHHIYLSSRDADTSRPTVRHHISHLATGFSTDKECTPVSNIQCTVLSSVFALLNCLTKLDTVNRSSWLMCVWVKGLSLLLCRTHSSINQWRTQLQWRTQHASFLGMLCTYHVIALQQGRMPNSVNFGWRLTAFHKRTENTGVCFLPLPTGIHFCKLHKITLTSRTTIRFSKIFC